MLGKRCWLIVVVLAAAVLAEESLNPAGLKVGAWGWLTMGKVESSYTEGMGGGIGTGFDVNLNKEWLYDYNAGISIINTFSENSKARFHLGITTTYVVPNKNLQSVEFWRRIFALYLIDAAVERTIPVNDVNSFRLEFGFFPIKYNQQSRNLGEYLFRSNVYPQVVISGFELADKMKLVGFHGGHQLNFITNSKLNTDLFVTTGMETYPTGNISLSLLIGANLEQLIDIGAGISFADLISLDDRKTIPAQSQAAGTILDAYYQFEDSSGVITQYTFAGIKAMGRLTFNPKKWFKSDVFGAEDLKLYGEAAILGIKSYPGWYENINERIPVMFGFNFPCFKVLDVLSIELQWFGSKYWNSTENVWRKQSPVPYQGEAYVESYYEWLEPKVTMAPNRIDTASVTSKAVTDDDWKWSVYLSKKFNNRIRVSAQAACDNRLRSDKLPPPPQQSKYTEITRRSWKDWYWMVRIMYYL
jgi:hypothetical protein